jgi:hypothetical protein
VPKSAGCLAENADSLQFRLNLENEDELLLQLIRIFLLNTAPQQCAGKFKEILIDGLRGSDLHRQAIAWLKDEISGLKEWERERICNRIQGLNTESFSSRSPGPVVPLSTDVPVDSVNSQRDFVGLPEEEFTGDFDLAGFM